MVEVSKEFMAGLLALDPTEGADPGSEIGSLKAQGWVYKDFPKVDAVIFGEMMKAAGDGVKMLTYATYRRFDQETGEAKTLARGQCLFSPEGSERVQAYLRAKLEEVEKAATAP